MTWIYIVVDERGMVRVESGCDRGHVQGLEESWVQFGMRL